MEPSKFVDFLHTYPAWFRMAVVLWVLLTAFVISGFLLVTRMTHASSTSAVLGPPKDADPRNLMADIDSSASASTPGSTSSGPLNFETIDQYVAKRKGLDGRFVQLEQFDKSVLGQSVTWHGSVFSASGLSDESSEARLTVDSLVNPSDYFFVVAPSDLKLFVSSLRKGDKITVTGTIASADRQPRVSATALELM